MVFFRLGRPVQIALVGAALAAAPGCGSSGDDTSDTSDTEDVRDAVDDADAPVDPGTDADADADVPAEAEAEAGADADADADADVDIDSWEVVDPAPVPMCADVPAYTLSTRNLASEVAKATAEVTLAGAVRPFGDPCPTLPCLAVTPEAGRGTIDGVGMIDANTARFTYNNAGLGVADPVRLDLVWTLTCTNADGIDATEVARGTAWACRDWMSGNVSITNDSMDCMVVDPPPPPMAKVAPGSRATGDGFRLQAGPVRDGALRLRVDGPVATYRWTAIGGTLEPLNDSEAVFRLDPRARTSLVQVAGLLPGGVSVQVFRRHRG
jgi:hypothetical protein